MHKLKEKLMDELHEYEEKAKNSPDSKIGAGELQAIHMLTDTVKNIDKIEMLEGSDSSEYGGRWEAMGSYGDGNSYARRGSRSERSQYSREGRTSDRSYDDDMTYAGRRRDNRGRYSRDGGKDRMIEKLEDMMESTEDRGQKEIIRKCVEQLERT
jgi:hypothetical protein